MDQNNYLSKKALTLLKEHKAIYEENNKIYPTQAFETIMNSYFEQEGYTPEAITKCILSFCNGVSVNETILICIFVTHTLLPPVVQKTILKQAENVPPANAKDAFITALMEEEAGK